MLYFFLYGIGGGYVTIEFDYETFDVLQAYGKYNRVLERSLYCYIVGLGRRLCRERLVTLNITPSLLQKIFIYISF